MIAIRRKARICLFAVRRMTGTELICNGIVGQYLGTKQKVSSQILPDNAIVDEFGTSLLLNLGKANIVLSSCIVSRIMFVHGR